MAKKGTKKYRSNEHERFIASLYAGKRSPSSGAALHDNGDVRVVADETLFECKTTGEPGKEARSSLVKHMDKVADEAWEEGLEPAVALRFYMPDSLVADNKGYVDLTVRLARDDAYRAERLVNKSRRKRTSC